MDDPGYRVGHSLRSDPALQHAGGGDRYADVASSVEEAVVVGNHGVQIRAEGSGGDKVNCVKAA